MQVGDLIGFVLDRRGAAALNGDEGVVFGDPEAALRRLLITWMPTVAALRAAAAAAADTVLCHEQLLFQSFHAGLQAQHLAWPANRHRLQAAADAGVTVVRVHGTLDHICIWDDFVAALGIHNPTPGSGADKVLSMTPTTVATLVDHVKTRFGLERVRLAGDAAKRVTTVGFPWGGLGLDSNIGYVARCIELGADVLVAGECDEYGMAFAADAGVPMIETGHALSENIGLEHFAATVRDAFPELDVTFFAETCPFVCL